MFYVADNGIKLIRGDEKMILFNELYQTQEDKIMFMHGLIRLAKADGIVEETEVEFFKQASYNMGIEQDAVEQLYIELTTGNVELDYKEMSFDSKKKSLFFLREAIQLCYIDSEYSDEEQLEIRNIANELDISFYAVDKIEAWVLRGFEWQKEGELLLDLG